MAGAVYDLTTLLPVLQVQKTLPSFWLKYFPSTVTFDTDEIAFDKVWTDNRRLAPFVVPNVQGRVSGLSGYETRTLKVAYIKDKNVLDYTLPFKRMAGENLSTGSMSPEARRMALIGQMLADQKQRLTNRFEWLAAKAVIDGKVTISGEDYPSTLVDFRRHANLTITLTGAAKWDQATGAPLTNLKAARVESNYRSGARITTCVFGATAWDLLTTRVDLRAQMQTQIDGYGTRVSMMADGYEGYEYMGVIQGLDGSGRLECWVNTAKYVDDTGAEQFVQDQSTVVGVSRDSLRGFRCFGAIKDKNAQFRALEMFPKVWEEEDPAVEFMMTQSAPLMVPGDPNASFSIKVA